MCRLFLGLTDNQIDKIWAKCVQLLKLLDRQYQSIVVMSLNREVFTPVVPRLSPQRLCHGDAKLVEVFEQHASRHRAAFVDRV